LLWCRFFFCLICFQSIILARVGSGFCSIERTSQSTSTIRILFPIYLCFTFLIFIWFICKKISLHRYVTKTMVNLSYTFGLPTLRVVTGLCMH
jgi:hypothetical protein